MDCEYFWLMCDTYVAFLLLYMICYALHHLTLFKIKIWLDTCFGDLLPELN
jgi:hypothetical protein